MISYTVSSLHPSLQLKEAAPGSGKLCGSTFLNRIFYEFLNNKFKDDGWKFNRDARAETMEHFEANTKISFNGHRKEKLPVPDVGKQHGIRKNKLEVSPAELKSIFKPVIDEFSVSLGVRLN